MVLKLGYTMESSLQAFGTLPRCSEMLIKLAGAVSWVLELLKAPQVI